MKRNRATRGGDLTTELREVLDQCSHHASDIFDPMVDRAETAEKVCVDHLSVLPTLVGPQYPQCDEEL